MREGNTSSTRNRGRHSSCSQLAVVGDKIFGKYDRALEDSYPGSRINLEIYFERYFQCINLCSPFISKMNKHY